MIKVSDDRPGDGHARGKKRLNYGYFWRLSTEFPYAFTWGLKDLEESKTEF